MMKDINYFGNPPVRDSFLIFGSPRIEEDEIQEVVDSLRTGWISTGPKVARFEEMFKEYTGSRHALALHSCTAGLHLSMIVTGIGPGDEVITTPLTFAATSNAIIHAGARPVFVDVDKNTGNIDPQEIKKYIKTRCHIDNDGRLINRQTGGIVKAIIPVHLYGSPCKMDKILEIAREYNLLVIEDAAHAIEAQYKDAKIGNIGDLTVFSFYVTKNLAMGEGGIVTTNNDEWAEKIQMYGLHGLNKGAWRRYSDEGYKHYQVIYPGFKYNMMDIQAAIGIHQLPKLDLYLKKREEIWNVYNKAFKDLPLIVPKEPEHYIKHARHLYTILIDIDQIKIDRDTFQMALYKENIGTGVHFLSLHLHHYYKEAFGYRRGDFPNAEFISDRTISLPLSAKLNEKDIEDVIAGVRKVVQYFL